jgi:hypothetical protein
MIFFDYRKPPCSLINTGREHTGRLRARSWCGAHRIRAGP